ncbi:MAG TPA: NUDIX hydrolase [Steroidobacteraceae bacterium]
MKDGVRSIYQGRVVNLTVEDVTLPNGSRASLEIAHHPGGAAIVALDADQRVCLLRQYRHAAGGWITELPAGKLDNREPPEECAVRELAEEAGVRAARLEKLGDFLSSPGILTEVIHIFLAQDLSRVESQPEEHEVIEVRWIPLAEAMEMAARGSIRDGKTLIGLFWAKARLAGKA